MPQQMDEGFKTRKNIKSDANLPWWVEILFVQIGLPDSILRNILKFKRSSKKSINKNKQSIRLFLILLGFGFYINPIIRNAAIHNKCYASGLEMLSKEGESNSKLITIKANNLCHGGRMN